jgi:hypothetical protein
MPASYDYGADILGALAVKEPMTNAELREKLAPGAKTYVQGIDQALQKLRKGGWIEPTKKGWQRTGWMACPHCQGTGKVRP